MPLQLIVVATLVLIIVGMTGYNTYQIHQLEIRLQSVSQGMAENRQQGELNQVNLKTLVDYVTKTFKDKKPNTPTDTFVPIQNSPTP